MRPLDPALALSTMALLLVGACVESRRGLGDQCLKDGDCMSGVCSQLQCAAAPPTTDERPFFEGGPSPGDSAAPIDEDAGDGTADGAAAETATGSEPGDEAAPGD